MPERVLGFMETTGLIWACMVIMYIFSQIPTSELIWIGGFLQIVAFLLFFMAPNVLAKMSVFLWRNRGATARKIEKMVYDSDFVMEEE